MARTATKTRKKTTRVAVYYRNSTSKQDTSIPRQISAVEPYLKKKPHYKVVATYQDAGVSGDRTEKRVQFKSMIDAAVAGDFDVIVAFDQSRLGRFDSIDMGRYYAPLRDAGIIIETVTDGVMDWHSLGGRIVAAVESEAKNDLVRRNSQATVTGQTRKAKEGHGYPGGPTPYGYKRVFKEIDGKPVGVLEVHKDDAAVVRRIFKLYTDPHGTLRSVAQQLNREGIPSPKGGKWAKNSISRILENELYIGTYAWGLRQTGRYFSRDEDGALLERRKSDTVETIKPIKHKDKLPRIISDDQWTQVVRLRQSRRNETMSPAVKRPLSGVVTCGKCGAPMRADGDYFRCKNSNPDAGEATCPSYRMPADEILRGALDALKQEVSDPKKRSQLRDQLEVAVGRRKGDDQAAKDLTKRLKQVELEIKRGTDRLLKLPDSLIDDLTAHLEGLAVQRDKLKDDLDALESRSTGKRGTKTLVTKVMNGIDGLLKSAGRGDPVVVNGLLKTIGAELRVTPTSAADRRKGKSKGYLEIFVPLVLIVATLVSNRHTGKLRMKRKPHRRIPFYW